MSSARMPHASAATLTQGKDENKNLHIPDNSDTRAQTQAEKFLDVFYEALPHGEENAVHMRTLADYFGIKDSDVKRCVQCLRLQGHTIVSDRRGYFVPVLPDESECVKRHLRLEEQKLRKSFFVLQAERELVQGFTCAKGGLE